MVMRRLLVAGAAVVLGGLWPAVGASAGGMATARAPVVVDGLAHGATVSANWSGYAVYSSTSTPLSVGTVTGSWDQPSVSCAGGSQYSSFWVGIDGYTPGDPAAATVEQTGTEADCQGRKAVYYAWWSLYPSTYTTVLPGAVKPGDVLTASVSTDGNGNFKLSLSDATASWSASEGPFALSVDDATAEWIAEAPSQCGPRNCRVLPLADFGTARFSGASVTANPGTGSVTGPIDGSSWSNDAITMDDSNATATPSALGDSGSASAFDVTWASLKQQGPPPGGHGGPPPGGQGGPPPGGHGGPPPGHGGPPPGPGGH